MKIGMIIGRMQPVHLGHMSLIKKSLSENHLTLIILGSSGVQDENNIFTDKEREDFLRMIMEKNTKYKILFLADHESNQIWVENLNHLIKNTLQTYITQAFNRAYGNKKISLSKEDLIRDDNLVDHISTLTFYCGDKKNDFAIQVIQKHMALFFTRNIHVSEISRDILIITHEGISHTISSTLVRKCMITKNNSLLKQLIPTSVYKNFL